MGRVYVALALVLAFAVSSLAGAEPTATISKPRIKGQLAPPVRGASAATDRAGAARITEELRWPIERIFVEGLRDPDQRPPKPQTLEERFAAALERGSPELIAGRTYDGCVFDGSFYSCPNPLTSALRNLQLLLR